MSSRRRPKRCARLMKRTRSASAAPYWRYPAGVRSGGGTSPMRS
jgi:hypothetical protein